MSIVERPSHLVTKHVAWEEETPYRFTVEQYHRMMASGVLTSDDPVELLEGLVIRMAPKGPWHVYAVGEVSDRLAAILPADWHIRRQDPITLAASEPEPDIAVVRGTKRRYLERHPRADEVGLVVEVADTTLAFDRHRKSPIYAAAGIQEIWVLDLQGRRAYSLTPPLSATQQAPARYQQQRSLDETAKLDMILSGQTIGEIAVSEFLPPLDDGPEAAV